MVDLAEDGQQALALVGSHGTVVEVEGQKADCTRLPVAQLGAVVGGLLFSQLLTLYVTPVFYVWMEAMRGRFARKPAARAATPA